MRSTTTVTGLPTSASQRPAHSQPPRCGRARIAPRALAPGGDDVLVAEDVDAGVRPSRADSDGRRKLSTQ